MIIQIASGTGTGPTKMSAFDAALKAAGVANYNLIRLSSIVPPDSEIKIHQGPISVQPGNWGDKLYVVMAEIRVSTPNTEAWAGMGWVQEKGTGRGLFVEHDGANEHTVRRDIKQSLQAMQAIRNVDFGPIHMQVVGITCKHEPVCALAVAAFWADDWEPKPDFEDR